MKRVQRVAAVLLGITIMLAWIVMTHVSVAQVDDDYATISRMTTIKERREFFIKLTPERKSALWRKHYETELTKHPVLTPDQKEVVKLAIVIASPELFAGKLPDVSGPGSVFAVALESAFKDAPALRAEIFGQPAPPLPKSNAKSGSKG